MDYSDEESMECEAPFEHWKCPDCGEEGVDHVAERSAKVVCSNCGWEGSAFDMEDED
jgi:predicted RNA-binding Zn-ribbon protein involved in translation (DUF1610 family)